MSAYFYDRQSPAATYFESINNPEKILKFRQQSIVSTTTNKLTEESVKSLNINAG